MFSYFLHNFFFYEYVTVFLLVGVESIGIPVPGETALVTAAIYAGATHKLNIVFVILAAIAGAIVGDNIGFWLGKKGGQRIVRIYGKRIGLTKRKLKLGIYLFKKHGGKIVFYGRFFALLRILAAFLAGLNNMSWRRFLMFNAAGGIAWSILMGMAGYTFGTVIYAFDMSLKIFSIAVFSIVSILFSWYIKRNEKRFYAASR